MGVSVFVDPRIVVSLLVSLKKRVLLRKDRPHLVVFGGWTQCVFFSSSSLDLCKYRLGGLDAWIVDVNYPLVRVAMEPTPGKWPVLREDGHPALSVRFYFSGWEGKWFAKYHLPSAWQYGLVLWV